MDELDKRIAERLGLIPEQVKVCQMLGGLPAKLWAALREKEAEGEWKDVRKELPDSAREVEFLVAVNNKWVCFLGCYTGEGWYDDGEGQVNGVKFWRECSALPAPPRTALAYVPLQHESGDYLPVQGKIDPIALLVMSAREWMAVNHPNTGFCSSTMEDYAAYYIQRTMWGHPSHDAPTSATQRAKGYCRTKIHGENHLHWQAPDCMNWRAAPPRTEAERDGKLRENR